MNYTIKIEYKTGDSFRTEMRSEEIEFYWNDINMAKESLKRIKNHYEFYRDYKDIYKKPECDLPVGAVWNLRNRSVSLEIVDDNGKPFLFHAFWTGYFEKLIKAEIVIVTQQDESLVYNDY